MKIPNCFLIFLLLLASCAKQGVYQPDSYPRFSSYREVPGVTEDEIKAIDALREKYGYFVYGMPPSTEAFENENDELKGFAALLCGWLTELFDIPFNLKLYDWEYLMDGLASGEISFSGELTITENRQRNYHMTGAIASRPVKYFRLHNSRPLAEIAAERPVRCGFIAGAATIDAVTAEMAYNTYEVIRINDFNLAAGMLRSGEIDAFYYSAAAEYIFAEESDIAAYEFDPLIYMPVSMATMVSELEPVISVVDKVLRAGSLHYLTTLYNRAHQDYLRYKLRLMLTDEELDYIQRNPVVPIGADPGSYPNSFYDKRDKKWKGIFLDILDEVSSLTGLTFERVNDENAKWPEIFKLLEDGEAALISELAQTTDRASRFIWSTSSLITDYYALISEQNYPDIKINEVLYIRVGLAKNTAYTDVFKKWFPYHMNSFEYESTEEAFNALIRGEVDMVMATQRRLMYLTHYMELPNYKANVVFDYAVSTQPGLNKNEIILCSIIDKAFTVIDSKSIVDQWMRKTYDYRIKVAEAQTPWFIGSSGLLLCVLILVIVQFRKSRRIGKKLEGLVEKRTRELAMQTTMLTTLFDSIPDLIYIKDTGLHITQCNKSLLNHFGRSMEEVVGSAEFGASILPHKTAEQGIDDRKVIDEGRKIIVEENLPRFDGTNHYFETVKIPLVLDGASIGVLGVSRDITARKEMEKTMESGFRYFNELNGALTKITTLPAISAGVLKDAADVISKEGCDALNTNRVGIWSYNEKCNRLESISYYDSGTEENTIQEYYDLSGREEYHELLKTERLIVMKNTEECKLISAEFDDFSSLCAALDAPIRVDGKLVGVVCIEQDCSSEFQLTREWTIEEQNFASSLADFMALAISGSERRKAREAAELASQAKSVFLANMSHEIRTPMNAILGVTEILIQNETLPADIEEGLDKIYNSCDLLLGIINDILDFSKIEAGKLDITPAQYKVAGMINSSVHLNMMRMDTKPIEFELKVDEKIPAKLIGDELRIKQILNNLLSNAFKYTNSGKVTLSVSFEQPLSENKGVTLVLSVIDTGCGMTKDQLGKMFEEYSRFHHDSNASVEGTGLGLAITQRLLNLMNGEMFVDSEPDKGSTFTVKLPQGLVDDELIGNEAAYNLRHFRMGYMTRKKRGQFAREPMPYGSVLIVDDVETNLFVAVGLMKLYSLRIDTAMSGQEAINKIKEGKVYDAIFMDHMMPEMDGIEAVKQIRGMGYTAPIVALTANAVSGQADIFFNNGFNEFISKPIDIRQLNSILNKLVREKQPPEVVEAARRQSQKKTENKKSSRVDALLMESFLRDARKAIEHIEEFCPNGNTDKLADNSDTLRKYTVVVHGIKSSLWNIGETGLSGQAQKLETSGRGHDIDYIKATTPGFLDDLRALLDRLEAEQGGGEMNMDSEILRGKMEEVRKMCGDFNRKGALEIISGIRNCPEEVKTVLGRVMEHVIHSEFEEAEKIMAAYIGINNQEQAAKPALTERIIPGLDIAKGLERYYGDENAYLKILRSYASSVRSVLGAIETVDEEKITNYKIRVHGIKGSSLDLFAELVGMEAAELEDAAKVNDLNFIYEHNPGFLEKARKLVTDIEDLLVRLENENPKPKKDKPDPELLSRLLSACKDYDIEEADNAMAEIEKFKYEADNGLAQWLRENMDKVNYTQIVQKLSGLRNQEE